MSIPLKKIQDIKCQLGIWVRIFRFGDIEIESAGTCGKIVFDLVPNPMQKELRKQFLILITIYPKKKSFYCKTRYTSNTINCQLKNSSL